MLSDVNQNIPADVREEIERRLLAIEQHYQVRILYACESGSRCWGFASPDSDYDIRFLYCHPRDWYLSVFTQRDVIEPGIEGDDVVFDPGGWDVKKALNLLRGYNGPLVEWLNAPIVYRAHPAVSLLKELQTQVFIPHRAVYHYAAMAQNLFRQVQNMNRISLKRYFYILRATLCALYVVDEQNAPPVVFAELFNKYLAGTALGEQVEILIAAKAQQGEKNKIERLVELEEYLTETLDAIDSRRPDKRDKADKKLFDAVFQQILAQVEAPA